MQLVDSLPVGINLPHELIETHTKVTKHSETNISTFLVLSVNLGEENLHNLYSLVT